MSETKDRNIFLIVLALYLVAMWLLADAVGDGESFKTTGGPSDRSPSPMYLER
jgi:hypothetical protein